MQGHAFNLSAGSGGHPANRIALRPYVIDEERVTGYSPGGPDAVRAVLVYRFAGDLIGEILILS